MTDITNPTIDIRERHRERLRSFLIFFSIVFVIYAGLNTYIFIHLNQSIPDDSCLRPLWIPLFVFVALSYLVGQYLESKFTSFVSDALTWIGAFWLGIMTWLLLAAVVIDLVRLADHFIGFLPQSWYEHPIETKAWIAGVTSAIILISMFLGFRHARNIHIKPLTIEVERAQGRTGNSELRIAAISDMHMGTLIGRKMVGQMVEKINSLHPDLVLMIGDQVDGNPRPAMEMNLGSILEKIESKYGVFAITGNHEYIGNAETSCAYLEAHGIRMIRDSAVEVAGLYLVGREDRAAKQFANVEWKNSSHHSTNQSPLS